MPIANFKELEAPQSDLDTFWKTVESKLQSVIDPHTYVDVYDRIYDGNSGKVRLFIKRMPNHFCTLKFNLFFPGDSRNYHASYNGVINVLAERCSDLKVSLYNLPKLNEEFVYLKRVDFHESVQIQLKHYESENILDPHSNHNQCDNVRKAISNFANGNGGALVLGVTDDGVAKGQYLEGDYDGVIVERVNTLIGKMYWSVNPQRREHWDVKFFPLRGKDDYYVIVIYVAGVFGGVFAKCPESFELRPCEDGSELDIHRLSFVEWRQRMVGETDSQADSKGLDLVCTSF